MRKNTSRPAGIRSGRSTPLRWRRTASAVSERVAATTSQLSPASIRNALRALWQCLIETTSAGGDGFEFYIFELDLPRGRLVGYPSHFNSEFDVVKPRISVALTVVAFKDRFQPIAGLRHNEEKFERERQKLALQLCRMVRNAAPTHVSQTQRRVWVTLASGDLHLGHLSLLMGEDFEIEPLLRSYLRRRIAVLAQSSRTGVALRMARAKGLGITDSKVGGVPYARRTTKWPTCPECGESLTFLLQIHRHDFPQMWFPKGANLFQIYRCPHGRRCAHVPERDSFVHVNWVRVRRSRDGDDRKVADLQSKPLVERKLIGRDIEDYPTGLWEARQAWWGRDWEELYDKCTVDDIDNDNWFYASKLFKRVESNHAGLKIGGLPHWQQYVDEPVCKCGTKKAFVLQIASAKFDAHWPEGCLFFFVCQDCGKESLETRWDVG